MFLNLDDKFINKYAKSTSHEKGFHILTALTRMSKEDLGAMAKIFSLILRSKREEEDTKLRVYQPSESTPSTTDLRQQLWEISMESGRERSKKL